MALSYAPDPFHHYVIPKYSVSCPSQHLLVGPIVLYVLHFCLQLDTPKCSCTSTKNLFLRCLNIYFYGSALFPLCSTSLMTKNNIRRGDSIKGVLSKAIGHTRIHTTTIIFSLRFSAYEMDSWLVALWPVESIQGLVRQETVYGSKGT